MQTAFTFKALRQDGSLETGVIKAVSWDQAYKQLQGSALRPIHLRAEAPSRLRLRRRTRISLRDLSLFTYQFAVLLEARIPISEGLRSIALEEPNSAMRQMVEQIAVSIEAGNTITEAMSPFAAVLGDIYIETIHAGERSGNLVLVLNHLAQMLEQEVDVRAGLRSAMMYPVCVVTALLLATIFLLLFVVPKFVTMFESRGVDLPLITQVLLGLSSAASAYWWAVLAATIAAALAVRRVLRSPQGRLTADRLIHRIPVLNDAVRAAALARFAHVFGLSLASGLNLIDCLAMSGRASGRPMLIQDTQIMADTVAQGGRLSEAMVNCNYLTSFARRLITAGETTAELPNMCRIIARHYDRDLKYLTRNMATLIEPIFVAMLAGIVLFLALAIFLPMWNVMAVM